MEKPAKRGYETPVKFRGEQKLNKSIEDEKEGKDEKMIEKFMQ